MSLISSAQVGSRRDPRAVTAFPPSRGVRLYLEALVAGESVVVRPTQPHAGLGAVVEWARRLSHRPVLVTDMDSEAIRVDPSRLLDALDEPLLAFHTSGSTGSPKCVVYRRSTVVAHARAIAQSLGLVADGTVYIALPPPRFAYGLSIVHSHHEAGVPVMFADAAWGLPAVTDAATTTDGPLCLYLLPQHTPLLLSADVDPARVARIVVAGGRLSGGSAAALAQRFPQAMLTNMYGQAELGPRLSLWHGRPGDFVEGTIGRPLPGVDLQVRPRGDAGDPALGQIHAATPYAMWRHIPPPYDRVLPGPAADEHVPTGDLGLELPGGQLRHAGRADHVLNVAGTKLDVRALTRVVEEATQPVVVRVGSRPARVGGDVVPVVEIVPGTTPARPAEIRRALHTEFGSLAGLCDIRIVDRLTLGESGK